MAEFFYFIVTVSILVVFHEFGHYIVARGFDVKILRFSVGFGAPLWSRRFGKDQTEWVVAAVPLGGYVRMLDEETDQVDASEKHRAFGSKPLWQRSLVVLAGPAFNMVFAVLAWWAVFMMGETGLRPWVGEVAENTPAAVAGFRPGDEIIAVNGEPTPIWKATLDRFLEPLVEQGEAQVTVRDAEGMERELRLDFQDLHIDELDRRGNLLDALGLTPRAPRFPAVVDTPEPDGAAQRAGLLRGDHVLRVNGEEVPGWGEWVRIVRQNPERELWVEVRRGEELVELLLVPESVPGENPSGAGQGRTGQGRIGIGYLESPETYAETYGILLWSPAAAFVRSLREAWQKSVLTVQVVGRMVSGDISLRNMSGPISIADYAHRSAQRGLVDFLGFLAIISLNLAILNMLPLPPLDGGHFVYYLYEGARGRPMPLSVIAYTKYAGVALIWMLIIYVLYNDVMNMWFR